MMKVCEKVGQDPGSDTPDDATRNSRVAACKEEAWEIVAAMVGAREISRTTGDVPRVQLVVLQELRDVEALRRFAGGCLLRGELALARAALEYAGSPDEADGADGGSGILEQLLCEKANDALSSGRFDVAITLILELFRVNPKMDRSEFLAKMHDIKDKHTARVGGFGQSEHFIKLFGFLAGRKLNEGELESMGDKLLQDGHTGLALSMYEMASHGKSDAVQVKYGAGGAPRLLLPRFCEKLGKVLLEQKDYERAAVCFIAAGGHHPAELTECIRVFEDVIVRSNITLPLAEYYYRLAGDCLTADGRAPDKAWHRQLAKRAGRNGVGINILDSGGLRGDLCDLGDWFRQCYREELDTVSGDWASSAETKSRPRYYDSARSLFELMITCYVSSKDPERIIIVADALLDTGREINAVKRLYDKVGHESANPLFYWRLGVGHLQGIFDSGDHESKVESIQEAYAAFAKCIELGGNIESIKVAEYDRRFDEDRHGGLCRLPQVRNPSAPPDA